MLELLCIECSVTSSVKALQYRSVLHLGYSLLLGGLKPCICAQVGVSSIEHLSATIRKKSYTSGLLTAVPHL